MADLKLGIDICFAVKRWPEASEWLDLVKNTLQLDIVEFDSDFLDPLYLDDIVALNIASEIKELARKKEVQIHNYFTGEMTHNINMFTDPDERIAGFGKLWFEKALRLTTELGAKGVGSHFGTIPASAINDKKEYGYYIDKKIDTIIYLSEIAYNEGHKILMLEQMYSPAEPPYTIKQTYNMLERINKSSKLFVSPVIDLGHSCCQNFDHSEEDRNPYNWLREFGSICEVIHIQQATSEVSNHWPFTKEYNEKGIIKPEKVIQSIQKSGSKEIYLMLEVFFPLRANNEQVLNSMIETVNYWKEYMP
jgi:D-erythrulose 1-phosphate 3-epimerase